MKKLTIILLLISGFCNSQIIKDSIIGKPQYVKEYVLFLQNSGPFTFMQGDDEYGHATRMDPKNLRASMKGSWFETDFCRYINNETYYDKNLKIAKEIWYYKSGEVVDNYSYTYDSLGRLMNEKSTNKYSETDKKFIYQGSSKKIKFTEYRSKSENEPVKTYFSSREVHSPFLVTKFDTLSKTDSIYIVTDFMWEKVGENSFQRGNDSIFRKKLTQVNYYDEDFQIKESKFFDYESDYNNKKLFQSGYIKYERDSLGRITKETQIKDNKYHYFILEENRKYREELKEGAYASTSSTEYIFYNDGKLDTRTQYHQGNISHQIHFEYNKYNLITKLLYLDTWGKNKNDLKPTVVTFKYKFDKHKNWTECLKNVDGKDLYLWKREIQYYK